MAKGMISSNTIKNVVIVGGGTAGWMTAAALSKVFRKQLSVTLIESDAIGTIGVGEATIPTMLFFNNLVGLKEEDLVKHAQATFKLGINFENWKEEQHEYFHAFGSTGKDYWAAGFHNFWVKANQSGACSTFEHFNKEAVSAKNNRFHNKKLNYAYHIDAGLYAKLLRTISEARNVKRIEGRIEKVNQDTSGAIQSVKLASGQEIEGDLFIDCSGFRGLLIEETLKTGYEDWSHWLPCNSALAVQTESVREPVPFTRSIAHAFGWQWQIPLQHRTGNGLVYCDKFVDDDSAKSFFLKQLDGRVLTAPKQIKFTTGMRKKQWNKNCVAVGLSGGFIEPLESTSIHLIQKNITRLIHLFPSNGISQLDIDTYNTQSQSDFEQIRDFIVLHYHVTNRDDSEFWRYCKTMSIPDSLQHRLESFKKDGRFFLKDGELFVDSWFQVMIGQGLIPEQYHSIVDEMDAAELNKFIQGIQHKHRQDIGALPSHSEFIRSILLGNSR